MIYNEHFPVMLQEVISNSSLRIDSTVIDMTLGRGGHSSELLKLIPEGLLVGIDQDPTALEYSKERLSKIGANFRLIKSRFSTVKPLLSENGVESADLILYDLGVSSPQFDDPMRGFSYRYDAPLDMRMDQSDNSRAKAYDVVNRCSAFELKKALYDYADEKYAKLIVGNIVKHRRERPIATTYELVDIIKEALPEKELRKPGHPAKKTFMAIRYLVNNEAEEITSGIPEGVSLLNPGGRLMVITFNSYEDGLVKNIFKNMATVRFVSKYLPPESRETNYRIVTTKPLEPSEAEISSNNLSKPAKLRIIERIR